MVAQLKQVNATKDNVIYDSKKPLFFRGAFLSVKKGVKMSDEIDKFNKKVFKVKTDILDLIEAKVKDAKNNNDCDTLKVYSESIKNLMDSLK